MVTRQENDVLTMTDAGTPMGEMMRRYWMPALLSKELPEPDCPPIRVPLLGEKLIAFRDTNGRVGLLEEFCVHRRASLLLGRNEECGLRCVFHGWKYDVDGTCTDMMNEPPESDFKDKIKITAYPTLEMGDVIWAYMGPKDQMPMQPKFEWTQVPDGHRYVSKNMQDNNWLQGVEGGVDTAHAPILHRLLDSTTTRAGFSMNTDFHANGAIPSVEVDVTDYGYRYAGVRSLGDRGQHVRTYHYVMPFHQIRPQQISSRGGDVVNPWMAGHMWVPLDDQTSMVYNWLYTTGDVPLTEQDCRNFDYGRVAGEDLLPDFRNVRNRHNSWQMDRHVQKTETFTGIEGINNQDQAVQEAMGYYGHRYVGIRSLGDRGSFVRAYHYVMPFTQIRPQQYGFKGQPPRTIIAGHMWVPMDDENSMVYNWSYSFGDEALTQAEREEWALGRAPGNVLPDFRSIRNRDNDWLIDREVQKTETFTGIEGINNQDQAVQESMGPIVDRTKENLSNSDMAIVHARRLLLQAANTVADGGDPPGVGPSYYNLRAIDKVLPVGVKWQDELMAEMYPG